MPDFSASALMREIASIETVCAVVRPGTTAPREPPPIVTDPPPVSPEASISAPRRPVDWPPIWIAPPLAFFDVAVTLPVTLT